MKIPYATIRIESNHPAMTPDLLTRLALELLRSLGDVYVENNGMMESTDND